MPAPRGPSRAAYRAAPGPLASIGTRRPRPGSREGQVAGDDRTGLTEAEHRDDQRLSVPGHHARGWSAATPTPSGGVAGPPGPGSRRVRGSVSGWSSEPAWPTGWAPAADPA